MQEFVVERDQSTRVITQAERIARASEGFRRLTEGEKSLAPNQGLCAICDYSNPRVIHDFFPDLQNLPELQNLDGATRPILLGKPRKRPPSVILAPENGLWTISAGASVEIQERFRALAADAGLAFDACKDADAEGVWLHELYSFVKENYPEFLAPKILKRTNMDEIRYVCEASATFCSWLERQNLKQTGELTSPQGSRIQNIDEDRQAKQATPNNKFVRDGDVWCISYGDESVQLPHRTGLEYIAILLNNPGKSIACTAILGMSSAKKPIIPSKQPSQYDLPEEEIDQLALEGENTEDMVDRQARDQYKKRARELEGEIKAARLASADWEVEEKTAELEKIEKHLNAATNWKGRSRKFPSNNEKARLNVGNAIDRAIKTITTRAPKTGTYLASTIQTGTSATYTDITSTWKL